MCDESLAGEIPIEKERMELWRRMISVMTRTRYGRKQRILEDS